MKGKVRAIAIIVLIAGVLLGGSGLLSESGLISETAEIVITLVSLTISINWLMIYAATHSAGEKIPLKESIQSVLTMLQLSIPICALFWWLLGHFLWGSNSVLNIILFCLALPCILAMPARIKVFSPSGVPVYLKRLGMNPIVIGIIVIGLIIGGVFFGFRSCANRSTEKEYLESLGNMEVEVYDKYLNDSTDKFDFAIRLKNGTTHTLTNMRFNMKVYDETGTLLVDTSLYTPQGLVLAAGEEQRFYVYVKQSDVESVEALYYADFDSLNIQMWITEVKYEEHESPLNAEYHCFNKPAIP